MFCCSFVQTSKNKTDMRRSFKSKSNRISVISENIQDHTKEGYDGRKGPFLSQMFIALFREKK